MQATLPTLLTRNELESLTGTKQPKRMQSWLLQRGWPHETPARRGDTPKVDRSYYLERMSGRQTSSRRIEPRFDLVRAR